MRLYHTYRDAGFVDSATMISHLSRCGVNRQMVDYFVETIRSLPPKILQFGIATPEEVGIDTLAERMERQRAASWILSGLACAISRLGPASLGSSLCTPNCAAEPRFERFADSIQDGLDQPSSEAYKIDIFGRAQRPGRCSL
jgi:hypothetical protein